MLILFLLASTTVGDATLYCRRAHARAWADASPLVFPQLVGEGFRYPTGTVDPQLVGGVGTYQLRVGLAYSLTDLYRGVKTMTAASADCALEESRVDLDQVLPAAGDIGKHEAFRKQVAYLDEQRPRWLSIQKIAGERLAVRSITYTEFSELRKRVTQLERKSAQVRGELARVQAEQVGVIDRPLNEISRTYVERSGVYERRTDDARFVQAWQFRISGGVVPLQLNDAGGVVGSNRMDWYGLIELQIRLGALSGDGGYLSAREAEVKSARYEVPQKIAALERQLNAALVEARAELVAVDEQLRATNDAINVFQHSDAERAAHTISMLSLDSIEFSADSLYLRTLVEQLISAIGGRS